MQKIYKTFIIIFFSGTLLYGQQSGPATDDDTPLFLQSTDLAKGAHHVEHVKFFGGYTNGYNLAILKGIDIVQSHAMDGGSYFTGITSNPPESPVCYDLALFGKPLIDAPRSSSYCSGATFSAFIEALNLLISGDEQKLSPVIREALHMQEPDGTRRNDHVKFWGHWNADGFGNHFALVQYSGMGTEIEPKNCRPGDFVNISWKSGFGHSVIFLGWVNRESEHHMLYWSSQKATNGYGDQLVPLSKIKEIKAVRLTNPDGLFGFDPERSVDNEIPGDKINLAE